jgi:hypothetical protein
LSDKTCRGFIQRGGAGLQLSGRFFAAPLLKLLMKDTALIARLNDGSSDPSNTEIGRGVQEICTRPSAARMMFPVSDRGE